MQINLIEAIHKAVSERNQIKMEHKIKVDELESLKKSSKTDEANDEQKINLVEVEISLCKSVVIKTHSNCINPMCIIIVSENLIDKDELIYKLQLVYQSVRALPYMLALQASAATDQEIERLPDWA